MKYADVILPIPSDINFTYKIPEGMKIDKGFRVIVPLGSSGRTVTGFVTAVKKDHAESSFEIKSIKSSLDTEAVFDDSVLSLASFIAENYSCSVGEAFDVILPSTKSSGDDAEYSDNDIFSIELSKTQHAVYDSIKDDSGTHLIYGITGSGKTELYLKLAENELSKGKSVIILLPEISLSWQIFSRIKAVFGDKAVLYHSALTPKQKMKSWLSFYKGNAKIAVGTRSAVFMQSPDLSMIVIDEEHDASYKEHSVPRYNAKRIALHRMKSVNGKTVLGSATPSAESYYAAKSGVMKMHVLTERYSNVEMPLINIVDYPEKGLLSNALKNAVYETSKRGMQSVLLLNRRGYSPTVQCSSCGEQVKCADCSVNMTYHKKGSLVCHYCGKEVSLIEKCPVCGGELKFIGSGTQKAEDIIADEFRDLRIFRLDQDSARKKKTVPEMIDKMKKSEIDVLLGTQMISKGFDFPNLALSAVLNADIGLGVPDFRSSERIFSLLTQLAGRCGRRGEQGRVIIQTKDISNPLFKYLKTHDYVSFIERELTIRKALSYPPFSFLLRIIIKGEDEEKVIEKSFEIENYLKKNIPDSVDLLGPAPAPIEKLGKNFRYHFILKSKQRKDLVAVSKSVKNETGIKIDIDLDPVDLL
ncbi:MAG: primosomal protein N' [Spirochaetes bacterium]|nr:primosomal protein N' [Spirochaetota bacterium]